MLPVSVLVLPALVLTLGFWASTTILVDCLFMSGTGVTGSIGKSGDEISVRASSSSLAGVFERALSLVFDEEIDIVDGARFSEDPLILVPTVKFDDVLVISERVDDPEATLVSLVLSVRIEASLVEIDSAGCAWIPKSLDFCEDAARVFNRIGVLLASSKMFSRDVDTLLRSALVTSF